MKFPSFEYVRPETVAEALDAIAVEDARVLGGGQSLMPVLALGLTHPSRLVDVTRIRELCQTRYFHTDRSLTIGAAVPHAQLHATPPDAPAPFLRRVAGHIGHAAIRTRGTFGGSIAHADPSAEWPALAIALDATLTLEQAGGQRRVLAREFLQGPYLTVLEPGEMVTAVALDLSGEPVVAFEEVARRTGDFALSGLIAVARGRDEHGQLDLSATLFGATSTPTRVGGFRTGFGAAERVAARDRLLTELTENVEYTSDVHASAATRRYLTRRLAGRVLDRLVEQLDGQAV